MTIRKDMLVLSLEPHVPFLLRFLELPGLLLFFKGSMSTLIYATFFAIDFLLLKLLLGMFHAIVLRKDICCFIIDLMLILPLNITC